MNTEELSQDWRNWQTSTEAGEALLGDAVARAEGLFGGRLVSAYALGSLAHGGFSVHVSDVDVGLVLQSPLGERDAGSIERLAAAVKASGMALSDRLSVFWGSPETLEGRAEGGRFPPVDRLDLRLHGRLIAGRDIRAEVAAPSLEELVVAAARQALKSLAGPGAMREMFEPAPLVDAGVRTLTKRVLFPVRFLHTARTGEIGRNDAAVAHFIASHSGPAADLAFEAFRWRYQPFAPEDPAVLNLVRAGLPGIYTDFIDEYRSRLASCGEAELARAYADWRASFGRRA